VEARTIGISVSGNEGLPGKYRFHISPRHSIQTVRESRSTRLVQQAVDRDP
jgi:hypothetical protein